MLISTTINSYRAHFWLGKCPGPMSVLITKSTFSQSGAKAGKTKDWSAKNSKLLRTEIILPVMRSQYSQEESFNANVW